MNGNTPCEWRLPASLEWLSLQLASEEPVIGALRHLANFTGLVSARQTFLKHLLASPSNKTQHIGPDLPWLNPGSRRDYEWWVVPSRCCLHCVLFSQDLVIDLCTCASDDGRLV